MHNKNICNILYCNYPYTFLGRRELTKRGRLVTLSTIKIVKLVYFKVTVAEKYFSFHAIKNEP